MNRKLRNIVMVIILILSIGSLVFTSYMAYKSNINIMYYVLLFIEAMVFVGIIIYLIMSEFNYKYLDEVFNGNSNKVLFIVLTIIISILISFGNGLVVNKLISNKDTKIVDNKENDDKELVEPPEKPDDMPPLDKDKEPPLDKDSKPPLNNESDVNSSGVKEVVSEEEIKSDLETDKENESVILVKDGGNAKVNGINLNKSGDVTNIESSEFKGINSGILVEKGSNAEIVNSIIKTNAKGSNAVFATGENSKIIISNSTIETSGANGSRGLDATYGGTIEADNVKITTKGASSAALATDRGEGTISVANGDLTTSGKGSPIIYSTGNISITDSKGVANGSQMVVVEGKNSANITNSSLIASGLGNRDNVDNSGIMIYQSMSGDANNGKGVFNATDSFLEIAHSSSVYKTAPMFLVTNTVADINLKNTKLTYGSNILLSVVATSEWGKEGENGGIVSFNAINQSLKGNIIVDNLSTLEFNLTNSTYRGSINNANSAKKVVLKLDADSKITLTDDCYVTELVNSNSVNGNIDLNGHKLYVNGYSIK